MIPAKQLFQDNPGPKSHQWHPRWPTPRVAQSPLPPGTQPPSGPVGPPAQHSAQAARFASMQHGSPQRKLGHCLPQRPPGSASLPRCRMQARAFSATAPTREHFSAVLQAYEVCKGQCLC
eukprot:scaffold66550_cov18-Tisochrysis_lutea.AAC.1